MNADKLNALGAETDEAEGELPPTPEQIQEAQALDAQERAAMEWGGIAFTIGGALSMLAPELRQVYTKEACLNWGRSVVPVAEKYGWGSSAKVPELMLLMSTMGLVIPSFFIIRMRLKEGPEKAGGVVGGIKAWWRERVARRAAAMGREVAEGAGNGG